MTEKRNNWNELLSRAGQERIARRTALLNELEFVRKEIRNVGCNFIRYDELKAQQRSIVAELATIKN